LGLYYADFGEEGNGESGLVISPDGKPIPQKANDPAAPTLPGLHVNGRHFKFVWSRFSPQGFAFRTVRVDGSEYSFQGKFGRERVDVIPEVPYLAGVLTKNRNSRVVRGRLSMRTLGTGRGAGENPAPLCGLRHLVCAGLAAAQEGARTRHLAAAAACAPLPGGKPRTPRALAHREPRILPQGRVRNAAAREFSMRRAVSTGRSAIAAPFFVVL
jgi:hypothetical protein